MIQNNLKCFLAFLGVLRRLETFSIILNYFKKFFQFICQHFIESLKSAATFTEKRIDSIATQIEQKLETEYSYKLQMRDKDIVNLNNKIHFLEQEIAKRDKPLSDAKVYVSHFFLIYIYSHLLI
jgi:hypothetical protein